MEKRLKQQRNRLFLRITMIFLAVWLVVSLTYCAIILYSEKQNVQARERVNLSYAQHQLSTGLGGANQMDYLFLNDSNAIYFKDIMKKTCESQIIIAEKDTKKNIVNTADKTGVVFGVQPDMESSADVYGFVDYNKLCGPLSEKQLDEIAGYLRTKLSDGRKYELVCTKFHIRRDEYIPLELKIAITKEGNSWYMDDEIAKTYSLAENRIENKEVFKCSDITRNIIPEEFIAEGKINKDYISSLTSKQREQTSEMIQTGTFEYIFYATDVLYLNVFTPDDDRPQLKAVSGNKNNKDYIIQYAAKINLLENCAAELIIGTAVIFTILLIIAVILCLMIWTMVRSQILQEQKRTDITNALAHDIKTPLFVISGYAYSLKEDIDTDERDSYIDKIIEQTDGINNLVHRMLELSKLDSYKMTLNRTEFNLYELTSSIINDYTSLPEGKKISLSHSGENMIRADMGLIGTVIRNLVDNAVRYSLPESNIEIDVSGRSLMVSNPSEPLSKNDLKQIWQPYIRKDKSRHKSGNGLGLSIVKSILELHGVKYEMTMKDNKVEFRAEF